MSLKVLTFNIYCLPPTLGLPLTWKNERIRMLARELRGRNYDVVCLQECFGRFTSRRKWLVHELSRDEFPYTAVAPLPGCCVWPPIKVDAGVVTFSKHPILHTDFYPFRVSSGSDSLSWKGVLYTLIQMPDGGCVHVFNTHMQSSHPKEGPSLRASFRCRAQQLVEVHQLIDRTIANDGWPALLLGDLNVNAIPTPDLAVPLGVGNGLGNSGSDVTTPLRQGGNRPSHTLEYDQLIETLNRSAPRWKAMDCLNTAAAERASSRRNGGSNSASVLRHRPVTYGDHEPDDESKPRDTVLTVEADRLSMQSLDYVFNIRKRARSGSRNGRKPETWQLRLNSASVEPFFVSPTSGAPFKQLSDHYAVEASFAFVPCKSDAASRASTPTSTRRTTGRRKGVRK